MSDRPTLTPSIFLAVALLMGGNGLLSIFLSLRMTLEGFATPIIGLVMAAFFVGLAAGAFSAERVIRRVGHIRAFAAFAALATATALLHGLYVSAPGWALLRGLTGFSLAGLYMVLESWLNEHASNRTRGRLFSLYMVVSNLALGLGQLLINLAGPTDMRPLLLAGSLFALCLMPVALTRSTHPGPVAHSPLMIGHLLKQAPLGPIGCFASGLVTGAFLALAPVYGVAEGLGVGQISGLMAVTLLGGLALQWPVGALSDHHSRRMVMAAVAALLAMVSLGMLAVGVRLPALLLALGVLFGGMSYTLYPLSVSHANDFIRDRSFVAASASLLLAWGVGAAAGPAAASLLMAAVGARGLFLFVALVALALALIASLRRGESVPPEEQTGFVPLPRTTPIITELDPRAEPSGEQQGPPN